MTRAHGCTNPGAHVRWVYSPRARGLKPARYIPGALSTQPSAGLKVVSLMTSRRVFVAGLLIGLVIRLAALPLPGTGDVSAFKIWSHAGYTGAVSEMYGVGGTPPERRLHDYDGRQATVDYPPLALYELAFVGLVYGVAFPGYPNTPVLTAFIKLLPVAAEAGITWVLFWAVRRAAPGQRDAARFAALAYWLNPAALFNASVLGYLDPLFGFPMLASLVAASAGSAIAAGVLFALAVLTKAQAVMLAPVVVLALWNVAGKGRLSSALRPLGLAGAGAVLTGVVWVGPVVMAGAWPNMMRALGSLARHDMLSGQAANAWWIVTYVMRAIYAVPDMGVADAFLSPVKRPLGITTIVQLGYPNPRLAATLVVLAAIAWGFWTGRKVRDLPRIALLGAWTVYAYFMLAVQVHENHFYMILPLLALAAAALPEWRRLFWVLSGSFALNLNLFYGLGDRIGFAVPRTITGIDATVWLSLVNVLALVWFARLLRQTFREQPASSTSIRAGTRRPRESSSP